MAREPDTKEEPREEHRQTMEHRLAALETLAKREGGQESALEHRLAALETLAKREGGQESALAHRLDGLEATVRRLVEAASHPADSQTPVADLEKRFDAFLERIGWQ